MEKQNVIAKYSNFSFPSGNCHQYADRMIEWQDRSKSRARSEESTTYSDLGGSQTCYLPFRTTQTEATLQDLQDGQQEFLVPMILKKRQAHAYIRIGHRRQSRGTC